MNLDDVVSAGIAAVVTVMFVALTIVSWPEPVRLQRFAVERHNPFAAVFSHRPERRVSRNSGY